MVLNNQNVNFKSAFFFLFFSCLSLTLFQNSAYSAQEVVVIPLIGSSQNAIHPEHVIDLYCSSYPGQSNACDRYNMDGYNLGDFTVPANRYFVLTSVIIIPSPVGSGSLHAIFWADNRDRKRVLVPQAEMSQINFSPGVIFNSGSTVKLSSPPASSGYYYVQAAGYLVNK